ncbi:MAG: DinB family protein [Candidatus Rokubacteria bacterium]|nr:DinB family protein [Candidatus Rokubacteria bacterium]MBI4593615.1 DinB family protein [Candidatus Rokubacteria bacterium]
MSVELMQSLYDYHWWANRRLWDVTVALGEEPSRREMGRQFSFPSLKGMFAHIYGADWVWLMRWRGTSPSTRPGDADFPSLASLWERWDAFEQEQRQFIGALTPAALGRTVEFRNNAGRPNALPLWALLQHVANHATHHRSEIATMLTMISGSPPPTDLVVYHRVRTGQPG